MFLEEEKNLVKILPEILGQRNVFFKNKFQSKINFGQKEFTIQNKSW